VGVEGGVNMASFGSKGVQCDVTDMKDGQYGFTWANRMDDREATLKMIGGTLKAEGHKPTDDFSKVNPKTMSWE
jgi:hypothetical protein